MSNYVTEFIIEHDEPVKSKMHVGWCSETDPNSRMYLSVFNVNDKSHTAFHLDSSEVDLLIRQLYGMLETKDII